MTFLLIGLTVAVLMLVTAHVILWFRIARLEDMLIGDALDTMMDEILQDAHGDIIAKIERARQKYKGNIPTPHDWSPPQM
jgi:hypothetical protein